MDSSWRLFARAIHRRRCNSILSTLALWLLGLKYFIVIGHSGLANLIRISTVAGGTLVIASVMQRGDLSLVAQSYYPS